MTSPAEPPRRVVNGDGDPDCPLCHGIGYLREDVPVGNPRFGKIQPCPCRLESLQMQRAAQLREESNTETLAGKTFDNFLPEGVSPDPEARATVHAAYERSQDFAAHPEKWLLLAGTYGCGKTHLAAAIANHCLAQGTPVLFLNTPDLLDYLRETFGPSAATSYNERFEEIRTAPILILDDLGTESPTNWATEKLYQLLNYRYNARLPTVITTNKDLKDIDQRIASRLSDAEIVSALNILAPDFRAGKLNLSSDISTLPIHRHQTFENFDARSDLTGETRQMFLNAIRAAREYAAAPGGWIVFVGPYGSGKTHLAAAMANHRTQMGKPVIFVTYQDLSDLFRTTNNRDVDERNGKLIQQVKSTEFLVLDDLPSLVGTAGYFREKFFQIFNYRYDAQLPTVLTTAAEEKELDPRIKSRIFFSDYCQVHILQVTPYRGKKKPARKK
jgi:DNA replication protein DnaC